MTAPLWITEQEVVELLDLGEAISALESGLRQEASGAAQNMLKTQASWGDNNLHAGNLHAIGAVFTQQKLAATKTWAHTEGGATPLLIVIGADDGSIKAIIEAFALGQMRTGGISGVATDWLAAADADDLALVGTGKQALLQVAAVNAVRPLKRVRVFSPRAESRTQLISKLRMEFDCEIIEARSVAAAVENAPIITLVTRATAAFLDASMVARGAHINAVGAISPEREEFAQSIFERASCIAVDSVPSVQNLSQEFKTRFGPPGAHWEPVHPLSRLIAEGRKRAPGDDLTLFKAMGMGIADLALGAEIYARALKAGKGRPFAHPQRAQPRIRPSNGIPGIRAAA
ncbi:MAG: ornithine cyclodeaminase family protein [Burkholderiaceae bacterium]|nr:ornithine cyclodeaminase family protein [Burkholderiaceae bacterium]